MEILHSHANVVAQFDFDDPALWRHQPLCARLRDDAGHPAHLRLRRPTRTASGSPSIAGREDWRGGAARRLGELSRRILRAAVPLPASDAQVQAVRALRQGLRVELSESRRSTTPRATAACARRSPTPMTSGAASPTFRSSTSICSATASLCCATRRATASASPKPNARRRCATSGVCGVTRCGSRRRRLRPAPELTALEATSRPVEVVCYRRKPVDEKHLMRCLRAALHSGEPPEENS